MKDNSIAEIIDKTISDDNDIDNNLVSECADIIRKIRVSWGYTPLTLAGLYGNIKAINTLVNLGADVNELDDNGFSALFTAARKGKIKAVKVLLELKADPNLRCSNHKHTALFEALLWDYQNIASVLINQGANVNIAGLSGLTALHIAAGRNLQGATEELIRHSANTQIKDNDGKTPVDYARENDHREILLIFDRQKKGGDGVLKVNPEGDISTAIAKTQIPKLKELLKVAKNSSIDNLTDELVIRLATEIQKISLRSYSYKADASLVDATTYRQMNCQSRASAFLAIFQDIPLHVSAIISPGHVVLAYKLSTGDMLVMDDVVKVVSNYKVTKLSESDSEEVIYADFFPLSRWGIMGKPEKVLMASYHQMAALRSKLQSKHDLSATQFGMAVSYLPTYPELRAGYSVALKLSGRLKESQMEKRVAEDLEKKIHETDSGS